MSIYQDIFQPIGNKYAFKDYHIQDMSKKILERTCTTEEDYYTWGKDVSIFLHHNEDLDFRKDCSSIIRKLPTEYYLQFYCGFADGQHKLFYGKII